MAGDLYKQIIKDLGVPKESLEESIEESFNVFLKASEEISMQKGLLGAIITSSNQATKLRNKVKMENLYPTITKIIQDPNYDEPIHSNSILDGICLAYLVKGSLKKLEGKEKASLENLHRYFDSVNWFMGPKSVKHLGIAPLQ